MKDIEQYLRDNKPVVKEDPTFILETRRRMESVEGIKAEVDRQSSRLHKALVVTLFIGLVVGAGLTALAYFYPVDAEGTSALNEFHAFLHSYRQYVLGAVALMAIGLGCVMTGRKAEVFGLKL